MTALSPLAFAVVFWGTIGLVLVILLFELAAVAADRDWGPFPYRARD